LLRLAIALPLALLIALSVLTHRATGDLARTQAAVKSLAQSQSQAATLLKEMVDNETGQRGYILSQDLVFLEPYDRSLLAIPPLRRRLARELVDAEAGRLFGILERAIEARLAFSTQSVELQRGGDHDASVALVQTGRGKKLMDQVRVAGAAVDRRLSLLIHEQEKEYATVVRWNERISWALVGVDAAFILLLVSILTRLRRAEQILHVCAWSRTVQYEGEWISYDQYLTRRFGLSITHGISPEEARKMRELVESHTGSGIRKVG
jgi:CHASE3 domain sensor protein